MIACETLAVDLIMILNPVAPLNVVGRRVLVAMTVGWIVTRFE